MKNTFHKYLPCFLSIIVACLVFSSQVIASTNRSLVIVSSFPEDLTVVFKEAFEKKNAGVTVTVLKKKTGAGIKYLGDHHDVDLFWVSAPDAFEVLKTQGLLQRYQPKAKGIPRRVSGYPVNDPDGFYTGFAAAGYGIMWNNEYLKTQGLTAPKEWVDLTKPEYQGHIGMSSPSRSGTTHLTIETILQIKGWDAGWSLVKAIAANAKVITQKSSHVPKGVVNGDFGIGIVIDFYGLAAKAQGAPVDFNYPSSTVLVPASIGLLKHAPHSELAKQFIEFLLSSDGQRLLLVPQISRLPIRPEIYSDATVPSFFPRPFGAKELGSNIAFNVMKSMRRYNVVNSLFDKMITYQFDDLKSTMYAIQQAEQLSGSETSSLPAISRVIGKARGLVNLPLIKELRARDPKFVAIFTKKRKTAKDIIEGEQGKIEAEWHKQVTENYSQARAAIKATMLSLDIKD